jgi:hypothetical protein
MAARLFLGSSASAAIVTAHAERITLITALLKQNRGFNSRLPPCRSIPRSPTWRESCAVSAAAADEREREHVNVGRNGGRHDVGGNGHFAGLG